MTAFKTPVVYTNLFILVHVHSLAKIIRRKYSILCLSRDVRDAARFSSSSAEMVWFVGISSVGLSADSYEHDYLVVISSIW